MCDVNMQGLYWQSGLLMFVMNTEHLYSTVVSGTAIHEAPTEDGTLMMGGHTAMGTTDNFANPYSFTT